jgi:hypothetical protein
LKLGLIFTSSFKEKSRSKDELEQEIRARCFRKSALVRLARANRRDPSPRSGSQANDAPALFALLGGLDFQEKLDRSEL